MTVHAGLLAWMGYVNSPTLDEVAHLPAGMSHWTFGRFELYRANPPLVRSVAAIPVLLSNPKTDWSSFHDGPYSRSEFSIGSDFVKANGMRSFWYFTLARWACIPLSLVGGWVCFRWACDLYGRWGGMWALCLWSFSPNIIASAAQITPDAAAAAAGCLAGYAFWRWLRDASWQRAFLAGLALGVAELTKTTWIILFALWPMLWGIWTILKTQPVRRSDCLTAAKQSRQLIVILLLAVYLINLAYGFEGSFKRLRDYVFISQTLSGQESKTRTPGNRFAESWLGRIPVPLPENYVRGIDGQKHDFEKGKWSYLRGEQRRKGWSYYYLYALAVKVPLGTWLLALLVAIVTIRCRGAFFRKRDELVLLAPALAVLVLVSSQTGFNRYLRYVLPAFPFAFIWISKVGRTVELKQWKTVACVSAATVYSVVSSLLVYPHSLSYFNELAGGPRGGHAHLVDGNIDWGQDLLNLRRWLDAHPEVEGLRLAYFGFVDPKVAGIEAEQPPKGPIGSETDLARATDLGPQPGWFAVSVNYLRGYRHYDSDKPYYTYFLNFKPIAMAGYSIYIYHITLEEANRVRRELGLEEVQSPGPRVQSHRGGETARGGLDG